MERPRQAHIAWAGLVAGITAYEVLCNKGETLSEGMDGWVDSDNKIIRYGTYLAVGATALHLTNLLPKPIDPFYQATKYKR